MDVRKYDVELKEEVRLYNKKGDIIGFIPAFGACDRVIYLDMDIAKLIVNGYCVAMWFGVHLISIKPFEKTIEQ